MKMRRILLFTDALLRAEILMPLDGSDNVFKSFLRESAVPMLDLAVKNAATNGTGCVQINVRVHDTESE